MSEVYKKAGVDIAAGEDLIQRIKNKVKETHSPSVLTNIGGFGGLFKAQFNDMQEPVLVSSIDGVGTKIKIAIMYNLHNTVGQDLVNHCVNDILVCGARPLFFLDYFGCGKLDVDIAEKVILGISQACQENNLALIGGETAEMPGVYSEYDYDLVGTIIGVVDKSKILDKSRVKKGDLLIGLTSSGLHTNGYSLARKVFLSKYNVFSYFNELGCSLGEALLKVHRSYLNIVYPLLQQDKVAACSHITGGGIIGNTKRVIPDDCSLQIDFKSWEYPAIFRLIQTLGNIPDEDMQQTFNLGIGFIMIVHPEQVDEVMDDLKNKREKAFIIGEVQ